MRTRLILPFAFSVLPFAFSLSADAPAQVLPGEVELDRAQSELSRYHTFITEYSIGIGDPIEQLQRLDKRHFQRVIAAIETESDVMRPWEASRFKAAAMMHTDAALRLLERAEIDGASTHLDVASQVLRKGGDRVDGYVGRWYQAVVGALRLYNWLPDAERFLATGRKLWPHDALILYESGTLQEVLSGDPSLPIVVGPPASRSIVRTTERTTPPTKSEIDDVNRRRADRLSDAARWLQASLKRDPSNLHARLHLGRVQTLRNHDDDARELLGKAAAESKDAAVAYLAWLFTAALHEKRGRYDAAAEAYRAAIERHPQNHAAHIGLSAVLQRIGRGDEARSVLRGVVDAAAASRREPWWIYASEPWAVVVPRLEQLRREGRQ